MTIQEKCCLLNELTEPLGYCYDVSQDIFTSTTDAWQKKFGYGAIYDKFAPLFNMVMDCQPVYFDYEGKTWLIEFWKGQYGMSAGAEVGIYSSDYSDTPLEAPQNRHYESVDDSELFPIKINLFHEEELMVTREKKHWWLTAFFLGRYCPPYTLTADVSIGFPDYEMCNAYIEGLKQAGYTPSNISRYLRTVAVTFALPRTRQPFSQSSAVARLRLCLNRLCCFLYRHLTGGYSSTLDRLEFLAALSPALFSLALRFANVRKRYHRYHRTKESSHVHRKPLE